MIRLLVGRTYQFDDSCLFFFFFLILKFLVFVSKFSFGHLAIKDRNVC